jgi:hypothetical protein
VLLAGSFSRVTREILEMTPINCYSKSSQVQTFALPIAGGRPKGRPLDFAESASDSVQPLRYSSAEDQMMNSHCIQQPAERAPRARSGLVIAIAAFIGGLFTGRFTGRRCASTAAPKQSRPNQAHASYDVELTQEGTSRLREIIDPNSPLGDLPEPPRAAKRVDASAIRRRSVSQA